MSTKEELNLRAWRNGVYPKSISDHMENLFNGMNVWNHYGRTDGVLELKFELSTTRSSATLKLIAKAIENGNIVYNEVGKCVYSKTHKTIKDDTLGKAICDEYERVSALEGGRNSEISVPHNYEELIAFIGIVFPTRNPYAYKAAVEAKAFSKAFQPDDSAQSQWLQIYNIWNFTITDPNNFERLCKTASKVVRQSFRTERAEKISTSASNSNKLPSKLVVWANKQRASAQLLSLLNTICEREDGNNAIIFSEYVNSLRRARINNYYTSQLTPEKFYGALEEILKMDSRYRIKPLVEYLIRQSFYYGTFEGQMEEANMLRDYARLALNSNLPFDHYPQNVYKAHNVMLRNASSLTLSEEDEVEFKKICEENKKYEVTTEGYSVVMPTSAIDVVNEGNALSHCVAGYVPMILRKETIVGFLRKEGEENTSLYTIEIKGRKVIQAKGRFDSDVPDDILDVIRHVERFWVARSI